MLFLSSSQNVKKLDSGVQFFDTISYFRDVNI